MNSQGGNYLSVAIMMMNFMRGTDRMTKCDEHPIDLDVSNVLIGITMNNHMTPSNCYLFIICQKNNYVFCYDLKEGREQLLDKRITDANRLMQCLKGRESMHLFEGFTLEES